MAKDDKQPNWNKADDKKLFALFAKPPSKGGIDTEDLGKANVERIRAKHWPQRSYKSFSALFRRKARQYNIDMTLRGSRKARQANNDEDAQEAEEEEEKTEIAAEEAAEDTGVTEEDREDGDIEALTEDVAKMTVVATPPPSVLGAFCMCFFFPYILYHYEAKNRKVVTIDLMVIGMNKKNYRPKVSEDGMSLEISVCVPAFFAHDSRVQVADPNIAHNTHKLTAFRDVAEDIQAKHGDGSEEERIFGDHPQIIKLPFEVEQEIRKWDLLAFENDDQDHAEMIGDGQQQFFFVLSVTMLSRKKRFKKKEGGLRVFGSPNAREEQDMEDACGNDSDDDY